MDVRDVLPGAQMGSDSDLLRQVAKSGDNVAMTHLMKEHDGYVRAQIRMAGVCNGADVDDIAAEVWTAVFRNAEVFNGASFRTWVWKITQRKVVDLWRKQKRRLTILGSDYVHNRGIAVEAWLRNLPDTRSCEKRGMYDAGERVDSVLHEAGNDKIFFEQHYLQGRPWRDIAKEHAMNSQTVRARVSRTAKRLRIVLQRESDDHFV